ncbi:MAG: hypothetical protein IKV81_06515 [Clostridia bacterium]|nr:hypothetical protein [Clostridia bacterium]
MCPRFIISTAITVITVDGTDTLVIDIPAGAYNNGETYCIITAQSIPTTATVTMPVAISIGGDTTTVYPLVNACSCLQAVACQVSARTRYKVIVQTNTVGGVFRAVCGLRQYCAEVLASLPVDATATATTFSLRNAAEAIEVVNPKKTTKTITTTKKEVIANE